MTDRRTFVKADARLTTGGRVFVRGTRGADCIGTGGLLVGLMGGLMGGNESTTLENGTIGV